MRKFIQTTLIGGFVFLLPLVVLAMLLGKAFELMRALLTPIGKLLPPDQVVGLAPIAIATVMAMLVLCFLAGLLARSKTANRLYKKLDGTLGRLLPGYAWAKGMTGVTSSEEGAPPLIPVMVRFDDQSQIALEVDRTDSGQVVVFLPGAPNSQEGAISFVDAERVEPIDVGLSAVVRIHRKLGQGAAEVLARGPAASESTPSGEA